jgi:hypothetical protein
VNDIYHAKLRKRQQRSGVNKRFKAVQLGIEVVDINGMGNFQVVLD